MDRPIRIAINGFGRIGRAITRQWMAAPGPFELVAINDIAPLDSCAYLMEYDSVYGLAPFQVGTGPGTLALNDHAIPLTHVADLSSLDLSGVDIVFECTGKAQGRHFAQAGLRAGAGAVLMSGPSPIADVTVVEGANAHDFAGQTLVSNASCTTNAFAPLLKTLDDAFGLIGGHMTTIHCYTGSQPTVDAPRGSALERNRAAALSMVPTTTSAARLTDQVLPHLAGRVPATAVRVPTASVSAIDLTCRLDNLPSEDMLHSHLAQALPGIIGTTTRPLVSADLRARTESLVVALPETRVLSGEMVRVFGWYDNEWGFSARMFDVARRMAAMMPT
ncbi:MAG: glyceraldehyde 3-phosphate dehydrogenase NAD-binding domain-containing protein [Pseudomonadota bacterium]